MEEILTDTEHLLARGRLSLPLSLCFAATRGDDLLLQQLLRRGSDPNEVDNGGRTALVCRSSFPRHTFFFFFYFLSFLRTIFHLRTQLVFFFFFCCNSILQHQKEVRIV